jgi:hypothetical protein
MEQALMAAQIEQLQQENVSVKNLLRNTSAHATAMKQALNDFTTSNVSFRAETLLLQDDVKNLRNENKQFIDRIEALEKENRELKAEVDLLKLPEKEAA